MDILTIVPPAQNSEKKAVTLSNSANIVADGETKDRFRVCRNDKIKYPEYEIWSNNVCKEDLITYWICLRNEL